MRTQTDTSAKSWRKYLERHGEPFAAKIAANFPDIVFRHVVAIPVYAEFALTRDCLQSIQNAATACGESALLILVVNAKRNDSEGKIQDNQKLIDSLRQTNIVAVHPFAQLTALDQCTSVLCVNCNDSATRFPDDEGVGLARKLACDIAVHLHNRGCIESTWLRNTDCDVRVPLDYFNDYSTSAACLLEPYFHAPVDAKAASWAALQTYEMWLHHYVNGLAGAGSPYAFHSLGSTITTSFTAYAEVRGFPKRMAGEDFHFLNKVAKTGTIATSLRSPIKILDRPSDRVPFGTGAGVRRILELEGRGECFNFYPEECFHFLKCFLAAIYSRETNVLEKIHHQTGVAIAKIEKLFGALEIHAGLKNAEKQGKNQMAFSRHFNQWFDGLKTLRMIHWLRDNLK